jgi:hypothetical protein
MAVLKNKYLLLGTIFFLFLFGYLLSVDEKLKPKTKEWLTVFEQKIENENNASLRLLSLGKKDSIFVETTKETYNKKLESFHFDGVLVYEKPMKYPNVLQFEAFLESPLFCEFKQDNCFSNLNAESEYLNIVIKEFQPELNDFMSLNEVENFEALNPFVAELKLEDFFFLFKLKGTEIYFNIAAGELDKAAQELEKLIEINRKFFSFSNDLLTKVSFTVNTENIFQPLLILLKKEGYATQGEFDKVLSPLSMEEISANKIQIRSFAKNARLIKAGLAAREQNNSGAFFSGFWDSLVYKENMTLNDMFDEYQAILLPAYVKKPSLLAFSKNIDAEIEARSALQVERPMLYRFKNITNVVGASLKDVIMPRQVNLYESIAGLDTRLQLLRLVLNAKSGDLMAYMEENEFANYYTGERPFIFEGQACHKLNNENVCVLVND